MVLPWLDSSVTLHSSRKDTCKLTVAQCEYRHGYWRYWYQADHVYGHATIYFMCAVIGVFKVANITSKLSKKPKTGPFGSNSIWQRGLAALRLLSYKTFHIQKIGWHSPPLGVMLLGLGGVIYFFALTLGPKPYYWPNTKKLSYGGSPPIATRTGWMSLALLPFVMLTASKTNYITMLTEVSHERLQVFHRWTSWTMFVLALVHTFPFIIVHIQQKRDMEMQWKMSVTYWTGVAALIPQAWLNIMSIGYIRNRFYEFFKATHLIAIATFVFFFFIHCDFRLSSWDYFIAASCLYGATFICSFIRNSIQRLDANARFLVLSDSTIRVTIPTKMHWAPGQHVFLRFWALGLNAYTTHPFTICSLHESKEMVFYIRPQAGITARLKTLVQTKRGVMPMSINGPYGDRNVASNLARCDSVVLIAGGSGVGFLFPILESVLNTAGEKVEVKVVIAVRHNDSATWVVEALENILSGKLLGQKVEAKINVTDEFALKADAQESSDHSEESDIENLEQRMMPPRKLESKHISVIYSRGRPDLKNSVVAMAGNGSAGAMGVVGCGPASIMLDIRDACAEAQTRILKGGQGAREVWLHTEEFSW